MMRRAIPAGDPASIQAELHIEILNADIMNQLVESALEKRRVNCADWF